MVQKQQRVKPANCDQEENEAANDQADILPPEFAHQVLSFFGVYVKVCHFLWNFFFTFGRLDWESTEKIFNLILLLRILSVKIS